MSPSDRLTAEFMTLDGAVQYALILNPPPPMWYMPIYVPMQVGFVDHGLERYPSQHRRRYELHHYDEHGIVYYREVLE